MMNTSMLVFLKRNVKVFLDSIRLNWYWLKVPKRVERIRKKDVISVLFVVSETRAFKSELLYKTMNEHPRFNALIGVSTNQSFPAAKLELIDYLIDKRYNYVDLDSPNNSIDKINPDLVFYYAPYNSCYSKGHFFQSNLKYIFCGINYCMAITKHVVHMKHEWFDYCWQFYVEHNDVAMRKREVLGYKARNIKVTGVPMQDILMLPKENFSDPWKDKTGKKRIIYSPHHSIKGTNGEGLEFATFLEFGERMIEFAKKYSDKITIAFKPHGTLYAKLVAIWGEERTNRYYKAWQEMPNTQYEDAEYVALFKYSDAIIHDCASFIIEYLYIDKPALYLVSEGNNLDDMFDFVRGGYDCYEHAYKEDDIERFILNVIEGKDNMGAYRRAYVKKELLPPGGKTACENIISAILGEK